MDQFLNNFHIRDFSKIGKSNIFSSNSMVVSSHPIASNIGIDVLKNGGNAVDAALAMSAVLCVAEPHMTGVGGDCFAMLSIDGSTKIKALNGSGKSSQNTSSKKLRDEGFKIITAEMPESVTIPGSVAAWSILHKEHGHMPWKDIFKPAIEFAKLGVIIHERVAFDWEKNVSKLSKDIDTAKLFLKDGNEYKVKDKFINLGLSDVFETISHDGQDGFYKDWIAEDICQKLLSLGGNQNINDFKKASAEWVVPITGTYRNIKLHECPPNGQGIVAIIILAIIEKFNISSLSKADYMHIFCEASKIGYFLRDKYLSDFHNNKLSIEEFLTSKLIDRYASMIDLKQAKYFTKSDFPDHADTIYLSVRDKKGMTISFINSLFDAFGSGITAPKSGVLLHCRGRGFNLKEGHPNELKPNKRPLHTIIPAMLSQNDKLLGSFGVMGGQYQAAGHAYVLSQIIDFGLNPQQALNYPRLFPNNDTLDIESSFDKDLIDELSSRGHKINYPSDLIGGGQMILIDNDNKVLIGASDWRKDGLAIGY